MGEKENKISETEQEEIKEDSGTDEEGKDEKETEPYVGMRGDGCILPDYWKIRLLVVILLLIIDIFLRLTGIW